MLASAYFIGYSIGASMYFLPDKIGRKKAVIFSLSLSITAESFMLWVANYNVRMGCFFFMGLFQLQNSTSYQWLYESVSKANKATAITVINSVYALPQPLMCLYVVYISKNWFPLCFWALMLGYVCLGICFFCPESPQWLMVHGHREEGIKALNRIAKFNGSLLRIPENAIFEEDPSTQRRNLENRPIANTEDSEGIINEDAQHAEVYRREHPSVCRVFVLLTMIVTGQQIAYMTSQFSSAKLPGNKWINGIEFGVAQFFSYNFANLLLKFMNEV